MDRTRYPRKHPSWKDSPHGKYQMQKWAAQKRGIHFLLTFDEWCDIWQEHWHGRGSGKLVMCRKADRGAYQVGNVFIDTQASNAQQIDTRKKAVSNGKLDEQNST